MNIINEIASNNILSLVLAVFGIVLSIFSVIFAIYVYKKDKTNKRQFNEIAKIVGDNIDLTDKKDKIKELSIQMEELNKSINEDIPLKAKKVALQDRLDRASVDLANCYNNVLEIKKELQVYENEDTTISNGLISKISQELEPKYLYSEKISKYTSILFLTSFVLNIVSNIPLFPDLGKLISGIFTIIGMVYIYKILKLYYDMKNIEIIRCFLLILVIVNLILLLGIVIFLIEVFHGEYTLIPLLLLAVLEELVCLYALHIVKRKYSLKFLKHKIKR